MTQMFLAVCTAVCNVLATSANRALCACATVAVNFGSLVMNQSSLLEFKSPNSILVIVHDR